MRSRVVHALFAFVAAAALLPPTIAGSEGAGPTHHLAFYTIVREADGSLSLSQLPMVPYLPGRACYGWRAEVPLTETLIEFREIFTLPSAPTIWSNEKDTYAPSVVSPDRTTSVTQRFETPQNGTIGNQWCVAEGDPLGDYSMEIHLAGDFAGVIAFELVDPETFDRANARP